MRSPTAGARPPMVHRSRGGARAPPRFRSRPSGSCSATVPLAPVRLVLRHGSARARPARARLVLRHGSARPAPTAHEPIVGLVLGSCSRPAPNSTRHTSKGQRPAESRTGALRAKGPRRPCQGGFPIQPRIGTVSHRDCPASGLSHIGIVPHRDCLTSGSSQIGTVPPPAARERAQAPAPVREKRDCSAGLRSGTQIGDSNSGLARWTRIRDSDSSFELGASILG
jgi:hypothetical protein